VIEEKLAGEELSWFAFCDETRAALFEPARDYKRVGDGDQGPNTGGMGAFSPVSGVPPYWKDRLAREVFAPILKELKRRGTPFKGLLYAGLMAQAESDKFWVIEFNARFGDPETQVLLPRMKDDLLDWMLAVARRDIRGLGSEVSFVEDAAVYVVAAAEGYPESPKKGDPVEFSGSRDDLFFAGVKTAPGGLETSGGRVLGALGMGATLGIAREKAYRKLTQVNFRGMHSRRDIAQ
jgi:phosphoribosylamine--glycine ligase